MSDSPPADDSNGLPLLLLIHGTSAGHEADEGERWWQQGSHAWKAFEERLGQDVDIPDGNDQEIFHWSGENGERARHQAAIDLLEKILGFERQGRPYHLIGHSHGGSVIWLALQMAVKRRWSASQDQELLKLKGLRSWATVGTPFLQFQGSFLGRWQGKVIAALTFLFVVGVLAFLAWHLNHRFELSSHWEEFRVARQQHQAAPGTASSVESVRDAKTVSDKLALRGREQIRETGERFGQAIENEVLRVSSVTRPNTIFDWILLGVIGVAAPTLASALFIGLSAIRIEAQSVRRESRIKEEAFLQFGERWLGIWSREDEAINGLRGSLRLSGRVMPRLAVPDHRVFISDRVVQFNRKIVRWLIAPLYNRVVAPSGDEFLWVRISKSAQGHDRPGCSLSDVTEGPISLPGFRYPAIPEALDRSLIEGANAKLDKRAGAILTQARSALSQYAWGSSAMPALVGEQTSVMHGDELVHTSYFTHPEVIDLLSLHIEQANAALPVEDSPAPVTARHDSWAQWLTIFKTKIREEILGDQTLRSGGLPELGHPNWLALIALGLWLSVLLLAPLYIFLGVTHPLAVLSEAVGLHSTGAVAGALLVVSIILFPLAGFLLSFPAVHRASRGALRGSLARCIVELSLYTLFAASIGFGGWYTWDRFFSKDDPIPDLALGFREAEGNLITATSTNIKLRHLSTGRVRATIDARQVRGIATSADQSKVAYATGGTIQVIDIGSRKPFSVIDAYGVKSIALNSAGLVVASGHRDGAVQLWYSPTGSRIAHLTGHHDWVRAIAFHPGGTSLASGGDDRTIRLWNGGTANRHTVLQGHGGALRALAYSPDGSLLASGAHEDESIRLWEVATARPLTPQAAHPGGVRSLSFHPSGSLLASGGEDKCVRIWALENGSLVLRHSLPPHPEMISSVVFDRSGSLLASRCRSQLVKIWDPLTGKLIRSLTDFDAEVNGIAFLPDSSGVFISSDHVHARVVDPDSGKIMASVMGQKKALTSAVSPKGNLLATADGPNVHLWNAQTGDWIRQLGDASSGHADDVYALSFSPDGATLASGGDDNRVILWTVATGLPKAILAGHTHWVRGVAFSPNGRLVASASYDQTVRIWNSATGTLTHTLAGHGQSVRAVAFRSDGKMLASGGLEPAVRLWEPVAGRELGKLDLTEPGEITALAFQPGGPLLATGGNGNAVKLWDPGTGTQVLSLEGHFLPVTALGFDPDGTRLASGSKDYTVRVWDTVTGALLNIVGDRRR